MNYELAKQLKDAGFTQNFFRTEDYYPDVAIPTLSELIEACGDKFYALTQPYADGSFEACSNYPHKPIQTRGSTPEEAVAKLWLALQDGK